MKKKDKKDKPKKEEFDTRVSLFDGNILKGKPLSEYNREPREGTIDVEEYIKELRTATRLTAEDYQTRVGNKPCC